jgi:hypothetical protein
MRQWGFSETVRIKGDICEPVAELPNKFDDPTVVSERWVARGTKQDELP